MLKTHSFPHFLAHARYRVVTRKITQYRIKPPCWYYYCPFKTFKIQNTVTCADNSGWILRKLFFVLYLFLLKWRMSQAHNG